MAARDVSDGGVATALAEMAFASAERSLGFWLDEPACGVAAFSEAPGFVLEVDRAALPHALRAASRCGAVARKIGETIPQPEAVFGPDRDPGGRSERISALDAAQRVAGAAAELLRVKPRVAVLVFPGTNSEDETVRALRAVGLGAQLVHWSQPEMLHDVEAFVLPGGFAYEDRIRAGAVAAHDALMDRVIDAAQDGKFVLGICNGAQILAEAGLVPGTGPLRRPTAAFAPNASGRFESVHVHVKLALPPERVPILAGIEEGEVIPAWASHGDGRLAAPAHELAQIAAGHLAFVYCDRGGRPVDAPNGSALSCAGLVNADGNVLAIMPHPERDAWTFQHLDADPHAVRAGASEALATSGGIAFFECFARAVLAEAVV